MDPEARIGEVSEADQRAAVVIEALAWCGTPWVHCARSKGVGVDCGLFLLEVFERCGLIEHTEIQQYPQQWGLHRGEELFRGIVSRFASPVQRVPLPGDVVLFRIGRCLSHGALVVTWPEIAHAYLNAGAVVLDSMETNQDLANRWAQRPRMAETWSYWR